MRGGGDGSATTDTVSATENVTTSSAPSFVVTVTDSGVETVSVPRRPGSTPVSLR